MKEADTTGYIYCIILVIWNSRNGKTRVTESRSGLSGAEAEEGNTCKGAHRTFWDDGCIL